MQKTETWAKRCGSQPASARHVPVPLARVRSHRVRELHGPPSEVNRRHRLPKVFPEVSQQIVNREPLECALVRAVHDGHGGVVVGERVGGEEGAGGCGWEGG